MESLEKIYRYEEIGRFRRDEGKQIIREVKSMCKVIAVANQKGGCSKTSVVANLGIGLALTVGDPYGMRAKSANRAVIRRDLSF